MNSLPQIVGLFAVIIGLLVIGTMCILPLAGLVLAAWESSRLRPAVIEVVSHDQEWDAHLGVESPCHAWLVWWHAWMKAHYEHPLPVLNSRDPDEADLAARVDRLPNNDLDVLLVALENEQRIRGPRWAEWSAEAEWWSRGFRTHRGRVIPSSEDLLDARLSRWPMLRWRLGLIRSLDGLTDALMRVGV